MRGRNDDRFSWWGIFLDCGPSIHAVNEYGKATDNFRQPVRFDFFVHASSPSRDRVPRINGHLKSIFRPRNARCPLVQSPESQHRNICHATIAARGTGSQDWCTDSHVSDPMMQLTIWSGTAVHLAHPCPEGRRHRGPQFSPPQSVRQRISSSSSSSI